MNAEKEKRMDNIEDLEKHVKARDKTTIAT